MKKWLKIGAFASTLAILAVLVLGASAFAQGPAWQGTLPAYGQGYGTDPAKSSLTAACNSFCKKTSTDWASLV